MTLTAKNYVLNYFKYTNHENHPNNNNRISPPIIPMRCTDKGNENARRKLYSR